MSLWIPIVTGVFTLLCALLFGVIAVRSKSGTLPRNSIVGIRLISTMQSDAAWKKVHQKTWMGTALISIIFFIGGITLLISGEMTETYYATIIAVTIGSLVPILIIQGILAHKAASNKCFQDIESLQNDHQTVPPYEDLCKISYDCGLHDCNSWNFNVNRSHKNPN
ncbi:SdpI family protein [Corynebacterium diphtheriae]